jgi:hypothetical protein
MGNGCACSICKRGDSQDLNSRRGKTMLAIRSLALSESNDAISTVQFGL